MGEILTNKEFEALRLIRNALMHTGKFPSMQKLADDMGYKSKRSTALLLEQLVEKNFLKKKEDGGMQLIDLGQYDTMHAQTVDVPLLGVVSCGLPILAEENVSAMIPVSVQLARPPHRYFLLRATGESMNQKNINDGDLVLVRQQTTANNGDVVVALIDDEATVKEFQRTGNTIMLLPRSDDTVKYQPMVLTSDFLIQGVVVDTIPKIT